MNNALPEPPPIPVEYGPQEGRYFTQWRIDLLLELLRDVVYSWGDEPLVQVSNARVWYDQHRDFHHLAFEAGGHSFNVRFYKVFGCEIDGQEGWIGCPRYNSHEYARYLRNKALGRD